VPGTDSFVVPAGITVVELTCYGGSAGGSGGARLTNETQPVVDPALTPPTAGCNGGRGGTSGKAITILSVIPGDSLSILVGTAGLPGSTTTRATVQGSSTSYT